MQFLRYLFGCLVAFLAAVFTFGNWTRVPIRLWSGLIADVNLPLLLLVTFLAGLLPMLLYHLTARWRLRQRLAQTERTLDSLRQASLPTETLPSGVAEPAPVMTPPLPTDDEARVLTAAPVPPPPPPPRPVAGNEPLA